MISDVLFDALQQIEGWRADRSYDDPTTKYVLDDLCKRMRLVHSWLDYPSADILPPPESAEFYSLPRVGGEEAFRRYIETGKVPEEVK